MHERADAEHKARACEAKAQATEHNMRIGAWRPIDIDDAINSSSAAKKWKLTKKTMEETPVVVHLVE
jgi:hypothetical protein